MSEEDWGLLADEQEKKLASTITRVENLRLPDGSGDLAAAASPSVSSVHPPAGRGRGRPITGNSSAAGDAAGAAGFTASAPRVAPFPAAAAAAATVVAAASAAAASASSPGPSVDDDESAPSKADVSLINKRLHSQLVNVQSDIEVLRKDPKSPLYHVKSFEALNLKPELLKGVYEMGFNAPSKIQETALPALLADPPANMIAQSQSGTGKTAAFVLTMLSRVVVDNAWPQCLCLAPTYELALQIGEVTKQMSKFMSSVSVAFAVRGAAVARGQKLTDHIVIGTPGTLLDWCTRFKMIDLKKVNVFVLDEADVMMDTQGHQDQSIRIQKGLRRDCQLLLFSATYDAVVMKFAESIVHDAIIIKLRREEQSLDNIKQYYIECTSLEDKFSALSNIYGSISIGQSMIFCHTKRTASWLCEKMTKDGHAVALLSGELTVDQRASVIGRFRRGIEKVLITTNVSARGIDVEQVTVVVNFDLPMNTSHQPDYDTYLHRIGRTGRFGKHGLAINMIDGPRSRTMLQQIESHFGRECLRLDAQDLDEIEKIGGD